MRKILAIAILLLNGSVIAGEPMIVAHRGASIDAPPNTIPAFQLAWEQGADAIEGDFHLTKDGHIVCIHDEDTQSVSGINTVVRNATLATLQKLDVGWRHGAAFKGTRIPTIGEVLSTVPDSKTIFIEIKCGPEVVDPLLKEIAKSGIKPEQVVIISFDAKVLIEAKAKAPQYNTSWLCSFKRDKSDDTTPTLPLVLKTLKFIQADGLSSNTAIPEPFIEAVSNAGYDWHVWTVDDQTIAKRARALGVTSITTNRPGFIKQQLLSDDATESKVKE